MRAAIVVALGALAALAVLSIGALAVVPGQNGKVAFSSNRDDPTLDLRGNFEIYTASPDGSGVSRLTAAQGIDATPAWSPDGRQIVFRSNRDHFDPDPTKTTYEIYTMSANGAAERRLTNNSAQDLAPVWSPDGKRIAFSSNRDGNFDVFLMNANGSAATNLTKSPGGDSTPAWSPDGRRLAFAADRNGNSDIYVADADGSGVKRLTTDPGFDSDPAFSPNGKRIVFVSSRGGNFDVYAMNADGVGLARLTTDPDFDFQPAWSPDGRKIIFSSDRESGVEGLFHLYTMNANGSGITRLLSGEPADLEGDWQAVATQAQAIAAVRSVLRAHTKACRLKIGKIAARSIAGGFNVTARLTKAGKKATAVFDFRGGAPKPVNATARQIERNCTR
jgi:Tol biopolymer transport system component